MNRNLKTDAELANSYYYFDGEKTLASLKGWTDLEDPVGELGIIRGKPPSLPGSSVPIPRWYKDNNAAFSLMVEFKFEPFWGDNQVSITVDNEVIATPYFQHSNNLEEALRYVIVQAAIYKLSKNYHGPYVY